MHKQGKQQLEKDGAEKAYLKCLLKVQAICIPMGLFTSKNRLISRKGLEPLKSCLDLLLKPKILAP